MVSLSACGSFKAELAPGTFVLFDQFVEDARARELVLRRRLRGACLDGESGVASRGGRHGKRRRVRRNRQARAVRDLVRWHPGYMSAPHTYVTDRLCFVISGTWWVNSGEAFEPENTVPVPSGGFGGGGCSTAQVGTII